MRLIGVLRVLLLIFYTCHGWERSKDKCWPNCECEARRKIFMDGPKYKWRAGKTDFKRCACLYHNRHWQIKDVPSQCNSDIWSIEIDHQAICDYGPLTTSMFKRFNSLQVLHCDTCRCRGLEPDFLWSHRNTFIELMLWRNEIREIPATFHKDCRLLQIVDYNQNQIEKIYAGTYNNLPNLKWVAYKNNRIDTIEVGAFKNLPQFEFIDLDSNRLEFVPEWAFDNYKFAEAGWTSFGNNRFVCNEDLCPFMNHAQKTRDALCSEPVKLKGTQFSKAIKAVGTKALQVRHQVAYEDSVKLSCRTCENIKLGFQKGTENIGKGTLPNSCSIKYIPSTYVTELIIAKVLEEHEGNYSCFRHDCIDPDCPIPVISVTLIIWEPAWNFSTGEGKVDEIVRHGTSGLFIGLIPLFVYSVVMACCISGYFIYQQIKKNQQPPQQEPEQQEA